MIDIKTKYHDSILVLAGILSVFFLLGCGEDRYSNEDGKKPGFRLGQYLKEQETAFHGFIIRNLEASPFVSKASLYSYCMDAGLAHVRANRFEQAILYFQEAYKIKPRNPWVHNNLGHCHYMIGKVEQAEKELLASISLDSSLLKPHVNLARLYKDKKEYHLAETEYQKAIHLAPLDESLLIELGYVYKLQGNPDMALDQYEKAIDLCPSCIDPRRILGDFFIYKGEYEKAFQILSEALRMSGGNDACVLQTLGNLFFDRKDYNSALSFYNKAVESDPNRASIYCDIADTFMAMDEDKKAFPFLEKAVELDPHFGDAHLKLGFAHLYNGKIGAAVHYLEKAVELRPYHPEGYIILGRALSFEGKYDEAIARFRRAIQLAPGSADAHAGLVATIRLRRADEWCSEMKSAVEEARKAVADFTYYFEKCSE